MFSFCFGNTGEPGSIVRVAGSMGFMEQLLFGILLSTKFTGHLE